MNLFIIGDNRFVLLNFKTDIQLFFSVVKQYIDNIRSYNTLVEIY
jgi:hypothetical protein